MNRKDKIKRAKEFILQLIHNSFVEPKRLEELIIIIISSLSSKIYKEISSLAIQNHNSNISESEVLEIIIDCLEDEIKGLNDAYSLLKNEPPHH